MATILLTFLGRVPKTGYRTTGYDFGDGASTEPLAFFGWALQQRLRPDRLVIFGTAGSMWEHLFEGDFDFGGQAMDTRIALLDAANEQRVTTEHLAPLETILAEHLGCEVRLALIPYCQDEAEQVELLRSMAIHVGAGDRVELDVTHGFRHLPMLALLAALYLRVVRDARIGGIWYGAYDPDTGHAPVHDLGGLLRIADWVQALHTYDKDGDYGVFTPLLGPAGSLLARAAYFERTSNPVKAREALTGWMSRQDRIPADDPAAALFQEELERRVAWHRGADRAAWEKALAWQYLERGDYIRAAFYALEGRITAEVLHRGGDARDWNRRDGAREELKFSADGFRMLNNLRNALAHGLRPDHPEVEEALAEEHALRDTLKSLLTQLLGRPAG